VRTGDAPADGELSTVITAACPRLRQVEELQPAHQLPVVRSQFCAKPVCRDRASIRTCMSPVLGSWAQPRQWSAIGPAGEGDAAVDDQRLAMGQR
jgi:hypothetical protein